MIMESKFVHAHNQLCSRRNRSTRTNLSQLASVGSATLLVKILNANRAAMIDVSLLMIDRLAYDTNVQA